MKKLQELLRFITDGPLGNVPYYKGKQYIVANAYKAACENNYLVVCPDRELLSFCDELNSYLRDDYIEIVNDTFKSFSKEEIRELVIDSLSSDFTGRREFVESSSKSIFEISESILNIDGAGHIVLDFGSGNGSVLANILLDTQKKGYYLKDLVGYEINSEQAKMSQMALDILTNNEPRPIINIGNALDVNNFVYTRGYCFPPLGTKQFMREKSRSSRLFKKIEFTARNTSEWLFVDTFLSGLHETGRAVAIVSGRALFNFADEDYRKALIESGLLEAIIELPNGSLNFTSVKPYLLVFSHSNKEVKLIDASDAIDTKTKRFNKVEVSVDTVLRLYHSNVTPKRSNDVLKNVGNLIPSNVLLDVDKPKNGAPLSDLAEVFTGNQYTLGVFEKNGMLSNELTGYRILTSSDIEDGIVDWKSLRSIKYNDDKFDKYAVKKNDVIVTSKSSKVKTVVVDIEPKEKILVTGGMIVVRPDTKLLNPTYLKIFLDSTQGQNALKSIQKGQVIVTINSKELATISIPVIDIEKQIEKANKYNEKLSTLYALKQEVKKLEDSLKNFYLDESEGE